jgi:S1-C subfamily serine protease
MRKTLVVGCILSAFAAANTAQSQQNGSADIPKIVASAHGAVVLLKTFDRQGQVLAFGSGFRVSDGRFVTNAHVVAGATRVEIYNDSGALLGVARSADMLSTSVDLAILPSLGPRTPYLTLAGGMPSVGEQVIVIGAPEGLTNTVSDGIVSAVRKLETRQLLQITAPISPGSSGGPVLNQRGEVVGVSVSVLREGQNLNFAVPVTDILALTASRPGQFEFPASMEVGSNRAGSPRSVNRVAPLMLTVGSTINGDLTAGDKLPSGAYVNYYRLTGTQGAAATIIVSSGDFEPFVVVFRRVGDSLITLAADRSIGSKPAVANLSLTGDVYIVGVGASDQSRAKMGSYSLRVTPASNASGGTAAPFASSAPSSADDRWLGAAVTRNSVIKFDRNTIAKTDSGTFVVWQRAIYTQPVSTLAGKIFDTAMIHYEMSCPIDRTRILSSAFYLQGAIVLSSNIAGQWGPVIPESVNEYSGKAICSYIKSHGVDAATR